MNSHNKPAQKAIHANNQPMEVAFHSAPGLSNSLQAVGLRWISPNLAGASSKGASSWVVHGSCRFYPSRPIKTCCFRATDALGSCPSA